MVGMVMQMAVVYVEGLQKVFRTVPLGFFELGLVVGGSLLLVVVVEVVKWFFFRKRQETN